MKWVNKLSEFQGAKGGICKNTMHKRKELGREKAPHIHDPGWRTSMIEQEPKTGRPTPQKQVGLEDVQD